MRKLNKGQIVILSMFAIAGIYAASLVLMKEPTPWRDIPAEGMSRNGLAFGDKIAEMRLYYMPRRAFPFYFADERAHYEPLATVGDPATIKQVLELLAPGEALEQAGCRPEKRDAMLHVITFRADGSVFGYVALQAGEIRPTGPQDAKDCTIAWLHQGEEFISWEVYDARTRLTEMTGVAM